MNIGDVVQGLLVFSVTPNWATYWVAVDLYGGPDCVCGTVTFQFNGLADMTRSLKILRKWERLDKPITLVVSGGRASLLSEEAVIKRHLEEGTGT